MQALSQEFDRVKASDFELRFRYPTLPELQELQILHRDMTEGETEVVENERAALDRLIGNLESGRVFKEDLSPGRLAKLRELLDGGEE